MCFYRHSWANWYNFKKWALKLMVMNFRFQSIGSDGTIFGSINFLQNE